MVRTIESLSAQSFIVICSYQFKCLWEDMISGIFKSQQFTGMFDLVGWHKLLHILNKL